MNTPEQNKPADFHMKEASRLRLLAAQTTTARIKDRLLDLAGDHERLAEQGASGADVKRAASEPGLLG